MILWSYERKGARGHVELDPEQSHEGFQSRHNLGKLSKMMHEMQHILHDWNHSASVRPFIPQQHFIVWAISLLLICITLFLISKTNIQISEQALIYAYLWAYFISYKQMEFKS